MESAVPHRDLSADNTLNVSLLKVAILWLLDPCDFSVVRLKKQCTFSPRLLASVALLWAWSDESALTERFTNSRRIGMRMFTVKNTLATSYQAFLKLLIRWTDPLLGSLQRAFRQRMQAELAAHWKTDGFVLFGVDGSKVALPRTKDLEASFAASRKNSTRRRKKPTSRSGQRKASNPQLLLTTLWHAGTQLLWDWRIGPVDDSERRHLLAMLEGLPEDSVITGDAGFVGYDFLRAIVQSKGHFLIRVGANVQLLKGLGYAREHNHTVSLWPENAVRGLEPPMVLRLAVFHRGSELMHVLTDLPKARVSDAKLLHLYRLRWGIEVSYRNLKETFGRRKLKSRSNQAARVELQWSLAGLWAMSLYSVQQLVTAGHPPHRMSCAGVLRVFRRTIRDWLHPIQQAATMCDCLKNALIDQYQRQQKGSRGTPRKRTAKPPGLPRIINATDRHKEAIRILKAAKQLHG